MAKRIDYKALIEDTLMFRCCNQGKMLEELETFLGEHRLYTKKFAEFLIDRWDIDEEDIKAYYFQ